MTNQNCRFCRAPLEHVLVDLGMSPLCESFLAEDQLNDMEPFFPLRVFICTKCFLGQLDEYVSPQDIFTDYAYFSSYSDAWVNHAKTYAYEMASRFQLTPKSQVVELASNDGYLLQFFVAQGIPALGIEPAANVAKEAERKGIECRVAFFGTQVAQELAANNQRADLITANNVLAHVNNINDFVAGMKVLLAPTGVVTVEFPHLLRLIEGNQFDTIYHEHFSYLSLSTVEQIFAAHDLTVFDVEQLWTHGGSVRIYAKHKEDDSKPVLPSVAQLKAEEEAVGMREIGYYNQFSQRVEATKRQILKFLIQAKESGATVVGYGAPGKGNTLLNFCGIRSDFLDYVVDRNPHKHGKYLPGTHIPIHAPVEIRRTKPDYVFILPWNLKEEIMEQMNYIAQWGGQFVVPIPELTVIPAAPDAKEHLEQAVPEQLVSRVES